MIRALLDTNVILDALLARKPFGEQVAAVWRAHEDERFTAYLSAITPATVFYVARKQFGRKPALQMVTELIDTFEVCTVNREVLHSALRLEMDDFEDAIQSANALNEGLDFIVTRDLKDYKNSPVKAISPVEFMKQLG